MSESPDSVVAPAFPAVDYKCQSLANKGISWDPPVPGYCLDLFPPEPQRPKVCPTIKKYRPKPQPPSPPQPEPEPRWVGRAYYLLHKGQGFFSKIESGLDPLPKDEKAFMSYTPLLNDPLPDVFIPPVQPPSIPKDPPTPPAAPKTKIIRKKKVHNYCVCRQPIPDCICEFLCISGNKADLPYSKEACDELRANQERKPLCVHPAPEKLTAEDPAAEEQ
jgi:hypothetical protein